MHRLFAFVFVLLSSLSCLSMIVQHPVELIPVGDFGYQMSSFGPFEESIKNEINNFLEKNKTNKKIQINKNISTNIPVKIRVLELAAADGSLSLRLFKEQIKNKEIRLYLNDLKEQKQRLIKNTKKIDKNIVIPIIGDARKIKENKKLKNRKFDFIIATQLIHFFSPEEIINFIADIKDLLEPSGKIILSADSHFLKISEENSQMLNNIFKTKQILDNRNVCNTNSSILSNMCYNLISNIDNDSVINKSKIRIRAKTIYDYLKDNKQMFPGLIHKDFLNKNLKPDFRYTLLNEDNFDSIANVVGLNIISKYFYTIEKIGKNNKLQIIEEKEGDMIGLIFEASKGFDKNFREGEGFKTLIKHAQESQDFAYKQLNNFKLLNEPPFIEIQKN
jgi:2-polyprenyl-3-methyl-5-hydroxy-6-metoxy-1,4-benzoquinol methylase